MPWLVDELLRVTSADKAAKAATCVLVYVITVISSVGLWVAWFRRRNEYGVEGAGFHLRCLLIDLGIWLAMAAATVIPMRFSKSAFVDVLVPGWKLVVVTGLFWLLGPAMVLFVNLLEHLLKGRKPPEWLRRIAHWDLPPYGPWRERMAAAETEQAIRAPMVWVIKPHRLLIVAARVALAIGLAYVFGFLLLHGFDNAGEASRVAMFVACVMFMLYRYFQSAILPVPAWKRLLWHWSVLGAALATALGYGLFVLLGWLGLGRPLTPVAWGGIWAAVWSLAVLPSQMDEGWRLWMGCLLACLVAALVPAVGSLDTKVAGGSVWLALACYVLLIRWPRMSPLLSRQLRHERLIARLLVAALIGLNAYFAATEGTFSTTLLVNGVGLLLLGFGALEALRLHAVAPKDR